MRRSSLLCGLLGACAALLCSACAMQQVQMSAPPGLAPEQIQTEKFATGLKLLPELSPPVHGERWRPGDAVLLGIAIDTAQEQRRWYLRATLLDRIGFEIDGRSFYRMDSVSLRTSSGETIRFDYFLVEVQIELFDEDAELISESIARMPELSLQHGLHEYIEVSLAGRELPLERGDGDPPHPDMIRPFAAAVTVMMRLPDFLQGDRGMESLLWRMIDRPGLLSMIANRGVRMGVELNGEDAVPAASPPGFGQAYRLPVAVTLNGRRAIACELVVVRGDPPLGPCNGLLAMKAVHPRDESRTLTVQLLGARRGSAEADIARAELGK